ncbi:hypothetical protein F5X97DRAFT_10803 [Nemania serpens]|nr:hypothetical protein F5X97DRAFT_10803 [Nemania serpens]
MGLTGVGKSTFISHLTGGAAQASGSLDSCTQSVREYTCTRFEDIDVRLIDTPGFDDSDRSDASVLKDVSRWLGEKYRQQILLHGVIYLHRITDMRMQMSSWRSLRALKSVCGKDALRNVYLATTMWEKLASEAEGLEREARLLEPKYWGDMEKQGCKIQRLQNNASSASALVQRIIDGSQPMVLQIQRELVDEGKNLDETNAGRELKMEITREREKIQADKEDMRRDLEDAQLLKEEDAKKLQSLEEQVRKKDADIESLQSTSQERRQEKARYMSEKQALIKEIETRRVLDDERELQAVETKDALEKLEEELHKKDQELKSMRFNLEATNSRQDHDLARAEKTLADEREKHKGETEQQSDTIKRLRAERDEMREALRAEKRRTAAEWRRGNDVTQWGQEGYAMVQQRDQTIALLQHDIARLRSGRNSSSAAGSRGPIWRPQ